MSKAFTKESDNDDDVEFADLPSLTHKNYVTPYGHKLLQDEFKQLLYTERPTIVEKVHWAAGNGDRSENGDYIYGKKRLREIDRRLRYLKKRLEQAHVVDPQLQKNLTKVYFGATVRFSNVKNETQQLKIVGIDEADINKNTISWISPLAKALLNAEVGDVVTVKTPTGTEKIKVIAITY